MNFIIALVQIFQETDTKMDLICKKFIRANTCEMKWKREAGEAGRAFRL